MHRCIEKAMRKIGSKEKVEIAGYVCWAIGLGLLVASLPCFSFDTQIRIYLITFGIAIFGIGTGFIGLGEAKKSDKRMQAMANLEFYEKIAVIESYLESVIRKTEQANPEVERAYANRIYYDIKGAKQLKEWVKDPEIKETLNKETQKLLDKLLEGQKYENLIKRLQQIQKGDC